MKDTTLKRDVSISETIAKHYKLYPDATVEVRGDAVYVTFGNDDEGDYREVCVNWEPGEPDRATLAVSVAMENPQAFAESVAENAREMFDSLDKEAKEEARVYTATARNKSFWLNMSVLADSMDEAIAKFREFVEEHNALPVSEDRTLECGAYKLSDDVEGPETEFKGFSIGGSVDEFVVLTDAGGNG